MLMIWLGLNNPYIHVLTTCCIAQEEIWKPLPSVIFGSLAVFTGCMVFMLPETKGRPVPDTIEEAEEIGRYVFDY